MDDSTRLYGMAARFGTPEDIVKAAERAFQEGYRKMDAYSPVPVHGLAEAMGFRWTRLPIVVFVGGVLGALTGFGLQYYTAVIAYPLNIGGRPYFSWPAFIPVTFEMTVLVASLCAVVGMLVMNGLPRPHHPIFNTPEFELASQNKFFLCIESEDPRFDRERTRAFLDSLGAEDVSEVREEP